MRVTLLKTEKDILKASNRTYFPAYNPVGPPSASTGAVYGLHFLTDVLVALLPPVVEAGLVRAAHLGLGRVSLVELVALLGRVEEAAAREAVQSRAAGQVRHVRQLSRLLRLLGPRPRRFRPRPRRFRPRRFRPPPVGARGARALLLLLALLQQVELTQRRQLAVRQVELRALGRPRRPPLGLGHLGNPRRRRPATGGRFGARRQSLRCGKLIIGTSVARHVNSALDIHTTFRTNQLITLIERPKVFAIYGHFISTKVYMYLVGVAKFRRAKARHDAGSRGLRDVLRLASALGQQRAADWAEQDGLGEALPDDARVVL